MAKADVEEMSDEYRQGYGAALARRQSAAEPATATAPEAPAAKRRPLASESQPEEKRSRAATSSGGELHEDVDEVAIMKVIRGGARAI